MENTTPTAYAPVPEGKKLIFRPWYDHPITGQRVFARNYGKRVFAMIVDADE